MSDLRLTQTVQKGGCAAKIAAVELRKILAQVKFPPKSDALLVDGGLFDDAAIYKVNDETAMVQTLDFFTPIVDTPKLFGRIASANALSDVYAMGGTPKTAMAILGFPLISLGNEVATEVLQGAADTLTEAETPLVGGHSIDDDTLKFGLSVTGFVNPKKVWANSGAKVGDRLILTKALGTGTSTAALKRSEVQEADIMPVLESMAQINRVLDLIGSHAGAVHAATDITGFGLLGHSMQMARASEKSFLVEFARLPKFEQAMTFIKGGFLTKAHRSNAHYVEKDVDFGSLSEFEKLLLFDPQTSGGLLLSVAANEAEQILIALRARFPVAEIVGEVKAQGERSLQLV